MEEERKVFSFGVEELAEAEELNARANTRMTEEYKEFLRQQYGNDEDFPKTEPEDISHVDSFCEKNDILDGDSGEENDISDVVDGCEENTMPDVDGCEENAAPDIEGGDESITEADDCPEEQSISDDFYPDDEPGFD
ncbi:MAG: hypothetical protein Q4A32_11765 [Lachnospiraceae bacterium]|nr:hypothetical protein [Lachnospiraceae bacterium]